MKRNLCSTTCESRRPVAQRLELAAHNGLVAGSSPAGSTNYVRTQGDKLMGSAEFPSVFYKRLEDNTLVVLYTKPFYSLGIRIKKIVVPKEHRGKGYASEVLSLVTAEADSRNIDLWVYVLPDGGLGYLDIVDWLSRKRFSYRGGLRYRRHNQEGRDYVRRKEV